MSRLPIRARVTLVFVAVMGVVLVVIGSFLYYRTKHNLDASIAQSLRARHGAARSYAQSGRQPLIPPGENFAQLLTPSGRVIASRPEAARALLSPAQATEATTRLRFFERHERDRYLAGPARVGGRHVVVVVGASLAQRESALENLAGALGVGGPLALALAAAIAYATAAGALRPVEEMRRRAATISRADPAAELPVPDVEDELQRLSLTLNEMLARISQAAEHERRFIANASHELRTPLAALQAELEIAERHATSVDQLRSAIVRSRHDVTRLIDLSNGLLDVAAADARSDGPVETVDIDDLFHTIVRGVRHRAELDDRKLLVRPSGLTVEADETGLRSAVANLVENALVHGAGSVTVGADLTPDAESVDLWVHDHGTLHESVRAGEPFDRFARGADTAGRPGAGLGLSLVRAFAEAHGGSAHLDADDAGGVRATLRLPVVARQSSRADFGSV